MIPSLKTGNFVSMKKITFIVLITLSSILVLQSCGEKTTEQPKVKLTLATVDSLITLYPDSIPLLLFRGKNYLKEYDYPNALADGAKAFRLDSNNIEARFLYAKTLVGMPNRTTVDVNSAQRHFKQIIKEQPKNADALVHLGTTYAAQQDFETAFKYVDNALRIDKKNRDAYVFKGSMFLAMERYDLAKSSFETAVQQDPQFYEAYVRLGSIYQAENNPICLEYFTTAYKIEPKNPEVLYSLAYANQSFNKIGTAKQLYRKMVQQDTSEYYISRGLFQLAYMKQFSENDLDSAIYFYSSAIETDRSYVEAFHNRGVCYDDKGDYTNALKNYSAALRINPDFELSRKAADKYDKGKGLERK